MCYLKVMVAQLGLNKIGTWSVCYASWFIDFNKHDFTIFIEIPWCICKDWVSTNFDTHPLFSSVELCLFNNLVKLELTNMMLIVFWNVSTTSINAYEIVVTSCYQQSTTFVFKIRLLHTIVLFFWKNPFVPHWL
jgi:hypothetical protein